MDFWGRKTVALSLVFCLLSNLSVDRHASAISSAKLTIGSGLFQEQTLAVSGQQMIRPLDHASVRWTESQYAKGIRHRRIVRQNVIVGVTFLSELKAAVEDWLMAQRVYRSINQWTERQYVKLTLDRRVLLQHVVAAISMLTEIEAIHRGNQAMVMTSAIFAMATGFGMFVHVFREDWDSTDPIKGKNGTKAGGIAWGMVSALMLIFSTCSTSSAPAFVLGGAVGPAASLIIASMLIFQNDVPEMSHRKPRKLLALAFLIAAYELWKHAIPYVGPPSHWHLLLSTSLIPDSNPNDVQSSPDGREIISKNSRPVDPAVLLFRDLSEEEIKRLTGDDFSLRRTIHTLQKAIRENHYVSMVDVIRSMGERRQNSAQESDIDEEIDRVISISITLNLQFRFDLTERETAIVTELMALIDAPLNDNSWNVRRRYMVSEGYMDHSLTHSRFAWTLRARGKTLMKLYSLSLLERDQTADTDEPPKIPTETSLPSTTKPKDIYPVLLHAGLPEGTFVISPKTLKESFFNFFPQGTARELVGRLYWAFRTMTGIFSQIGFDLSRVRSPTPYSVIPLQTNRVVRRIHWITPGVSFQMRRVDDDEKILRTATYVVASVTVADHETFYVAGHAPTALHSAA